MTSYRGSLARHWATQQRLIKSVRPMARQARLRSTPLDAANLHANATQRRADEGHLGGFCVWPDMRTETAPARSSCRGRSCRNSDWGWGLGGEGRSAEYTRVMRWAAFSRDLSWCE